ncbi:PaaI family thioesterase [Chelatococcus reniformis]|uniref:Thioesterase n=1 Tax=Chelatococcus reniformis TaxID=1494448 RepID=A0A916UW94_9HYPH|nr:PaaI family thioesterase [Chelatococcus reniformis]GGC88143.1 thioesterase [Chelatococcus reniformis]
MTVSIPEGFIRLPQAGGPFFAINGPLYAKYDAGRLRVGFRVEERHCNPMQMAHGGMLMAFADMLMPMSANFAEGLSQFLPTVGMTMDFVGPARLGSWVEGTTDILRVTRNLVFTQALVTADGEVVMRTSGTFKRGQQMEGFNLRQQLGQARELADETLAE